MKATKDDDAEGKVLEWDIRAASRFDSGFNDILVAPFNLLRRAMLSWWKRNIKRSFRKYLDQDYGGRWKELQGRNRKRRGRGETVNKRMKAELAQDLTIGQDALWRAMLSTFWEWDGVLPCFSGDG